ncbi:MAG: BamA/TamA family outer membrane protein [Saprospiraceae bacterium]|nr:BamA/TamA family outer membrane protein [Saprospiraceae bacterium]
MRYFQILHVLFLFICNNSAYCQNQDTIVSIDTLKPRNQLLAYPIIFYLPETNWGFGAAGFYSFRFKGESTKSNPSQIQFSVNYTLNKQIILSFPFELYTDNNHWKFKGELGYYRYQYYFFGIGNETKKVNRESFQANYPRLRLDVLRKWNNMFFGLRYRFDQFDIAKIKEAGLLEKILLNKPKGGTLSGLGLVIQLDTRDFIYNPTKGHYIDSELFVNDSWTASDYNYLRLSIDAAKYVRLANEHTLAFHMYSANITGNPLFYDLPFFGSPKLVRGYIDRRFIDKNILVLQTEYRYPIYKRFQGVAFFASGNVASTFSHLIKTGFKSSFGLGFRFTLNKTDRVRLRVDYGRTLHEGGSFYVTINDAF